MTPDPPPQRHPERRIAVVALIAGLLGAALAGGYAVVSGPARDTDVARFVFNDPSTEDAERLCADWIGLVTHSSGVAVSPASFTFETDPLAWNVEGSWSAEGRDSEPFTCTFEWYQWGTQIYVRSLVTEDGTTFGVEAGSPSDAD